MARPTIEITPWDPSTDGGSGTVSSNNGNLSNKFFINGIPVSDYFLITSTSYDSIGKAFFSDSTYTGSGTPLKGNLTTPAYGENINNYFTTPARTSSGAKYWRTHYGDLAYPTFDNFVTDVAGDNYVEIKWYSGNTYRIYRNGTYEKSFTTDKIRLSVCLQGAGGGGGGGVNFWFKYGTGGGGGAGGFLAVALDLNLIKGTSNYYAFYPGEGGSGGMGNADAFDSDASDGADGTSSYVYYVKQSGDNPGTYALAAAYGGKGGWKAFVDTNENLAYSGSGGSGGAYNMVPLISSYNISPLYAIRVDGKLFPPCSMQGPNGADGNSDNVFPFSDKKGTSTIDVATAWLVPNSSGNCTEISVGNYVGHGRGGGASCFYGEGGQMVAYNGGLHGHGYGTGGGGGDAGADGVGKRGGNGADGIIKIYY